MNTTFPLGQFAGLHISARFSALLAGVVLWLILIALAVVFLSWPFVTALIVALVAVLLHWLSELAHHLGHAYAASRTGYPMTGVRFWFLIASSLYPPDEPALPAAIHIRRALGGPILSFGVTLLVGLVTLALRETGGIFFWLALFLFLDNLLVFSLGAFLPLGFTDGSSILYWWGKR